MDFNIIDPVTANIQGACAAGSLVALTTQRRFAWAYALSLVVVGQVTAWYFTIPLADLFMIRMSLYVVIAFSYGALAFMIWSGVVQIGQSFMTDPVGLATRVIRAWRGGKDQ